MNLFKIKKNDSIKIFIDFFMDSEQVIVGRNFLGRTSIPNSGYCNL